MKSIKSIYKIGIGPSSSHTMGPSFAARDFVTIYPNADQIKVILYGSLAKTGKGHGTDRAVIETLSPLPVEVIFDTETVLKSHPNTIDLIALKDNAELGRNRYYSIGGGEIRAEGSVRHAPLEVYGEKTFGEIAEICKARNIRLSDFVFEHEGDGIKEFLLEVWRTMQNAIHEGLAKTGTLPGGLDVERKAQFLFNLIPFCFNYNHVFLFFPRMEV